MSCKIPNNNFDIFSMKGDKLGFKSICINPVIWNQLLNPLVWIWENWMIESAKLDDRH